MKNPVSLENIGSTANQLLETIQKEMFVHARDSYFSRIKEITHWDEVVPTLDNKGIAVIPWCEVEECEDDIKERSGRS